MRHPISPKLFFQTVRFMFPALAFLTGTLSNISAATETYSARSTYQIAAAALGVARNIDFHTRDEGTLMTFPDSDIHVASISLRGAVFGNGRSYYNDTLYTFPNAEITVSFPTGTRAFGVDLKSFYSQNGSFTVTLGNGEVFQIPSQISGPLFFGAITDESIQSAKFSFSSDYLVLDNFTFVPVPNPCSGAAPIVNVPGSANPWLAGMPQGSNDGGYDSVPGQSAVVADFSQLFGGVRVRATGITTNCPGCVSSSNPEGSAELTGHFWGSVNGIGNIVAPLNSLIGVFIDDREPNLTPPPPGYVDYSTAASRDYTSLSPALKQPFFIGDGITNSGESQLIVAPPGATRLFLGTMDGYEWTNNGGSFSVTVDSCLDDAAPISTLITSPSNVGWNNSDVQIEITADDGNGSGAESITYSTAGAQNLASTTVTGGSAAFTVSNEGVTTVTFLSEDIAGNIEAARTVEVKIDKTSPGISIVVPASTSYLLNAVVTSEYSCSDLLSGISSCEGSLLNGSQLDTSSTGTKSFSVSAVDVAGNTALSTANYTITYGIASLYDQTKAVKAGGTVPIRLQLLDANGVNYSSPSISVNAVGVIQVSTQASSAAETAGNSNPDFNFRYDPVLNGYIFNLKTTGLTTGSYELRYVVGGSATVYSLGFQVRE
jgi:hypothetical protein